MILNISLELQSSSVTFKFDSLNFLLLAGEARSLTNVGLDKFGEILEGVLPAEIARLQRNHIRPTFLQDGQLCPNRHGPQCYRHLNFSRQIWILESVRVTQPFTRDQLNVCAAE